MDGWSLEVVMPRKKGSGGGRKPLVGIRMSEEETARLDDLAAKLAARTGGEPNRAEVLRLGLKMVESGRGAPDVVMLPHYGSIPCGEPVALPDQPPAMMIDLAALFRGPDRFLLTARGQSMTNKLIADGDYLVIHRKESAEHGEVVAAIVDGEATLKIYHIRKSGKKTEHWLYPASDHHEPILIQPGSDARVIGVLVGVIRKC